MSPLHPVPLLACTTSSFGRSLEHTDEVASQMHQYFLNGGSLCVVLNFCFTATERKFSSSPRSPPCASGKPPRPGELTIFCCLPLGTA